MIQPGSAAPIGATVVDGGVNFSLYSHHAEGVELLLFDQGAVEPATTIALDPTTNRTDDYWHVFVPGLRAGQRYGYRVTGPDQLADGLRFDPSKVLLDPYARAVIDDDYDRALASTPGASNLGRAMTGVVVDPSTYDWAGDQPLRRPFRGGAIYELHVRGFRGTPARVVTAHPGTYAGLVEKIPYLQRWASTAVELMPVFEFDPHSRRTGERPNFWGYEPMAFFAPQGGVQLEPEPRRPGATSSATWCRRCTRPASR